MLKYQNEIIKQQPFEYFYTYPNIDKSLLTELLIWLEEEAPWKLSRTDFYEQYEFSFQDVELNSKNQYFLSKNFKQQLLSLMERMFHCSFHRCVDIIAHKLVTGQKIGIHNDFLSMETSETHRLLLQVNREWNEEKGGILIFFDEFNEFDIVDAFIPINGSLQGFKISKKSHHAVSKIYGEEGRYTLVYNFYSR